LRGKVLKLFVFQIKKTCQFLKKLIIKSTNIIDNKIKDLLEYFKSKKRVALAARRENRKPKKSKEKDDFNCIDFNCFH
jgi:hypothetical protein